jgi:hypothetical protein
MMRQERNGQTADALAGTPAQTKAWLHYWQEASNFCKHFDNSKSQIL